jgi:hypothetical protein
MSRHRWFVDVWDDDDPAIARMREALALRPVEPPRQPEAPGEAPDGATRRERVSALVQRIENGDLSAVATLRELMLDR